MPKRGGTHPGVHSDFKTDLRPTPKSKFIPKLTQDGTTNRPHAGGIGGGSAGKRAATAPAVKHSSTATHAAFRDTSAITPRKGGGAVSTRHNGNSWEITVTNAQYKVTHQKKGRAKTPEAALNTLVKEYKKHA